MWSGGERGQRALVDKGEKGIVTADDRITVAGFEQGAVSEDPSLLQVWVAVADDSKRM